MTTITISFSGTAKSIGILARFLEALEQTCPPSFPEIQVVQAENQILYVEASYKDEDSCLDASEQMAPVTSQLLMETGVYVALAPSVRRG